MALKAQYAGVLGPGGTPPGMPPDRGMELELETGDAPMPLGLSPCCASAGGRPSPRPRVGVAVGSAIRVRLVTPSGSVGQVTAIPLRSPRRLRHAPHRLSLARARPPHETSCSALLLLSRLFSSPAPPPPCPSSFLWRQELGFLGHRLSKEGVSVDPRKVQAIVEGATSASCCEARRFTGLANYYRRFVEGYAELAAPLTALGSPTARFVWTPAAQTSFDALKLALSSAPAAHRRPDSACGLDDGREQHCRRCDPDAAGRRGSPAPGGVRAPQADGGRAELGPVSDAGQEGEQEVGLPLNRETQRGVARYLVRWRGHTSADE